MPNSTTLHPGHLPPEHADGFPQTELLWICVVLFVVLILILISGFIMGFLMRWIYKQKTADQLTALNEKAKEKEGEDRSADLRLKLNSLMQRFSSAEMLAHSAPPPAPMPAATPRAADHPVEHRVIVQIEPKDLLMTAGDRPMSLVVRAPAIKPQSDRELEWSDESTSSPPQSSSRDSTTKSTTTTGDTTSQTTGSAKSSATGSANVAAVPKKDPPMQTPKSNGIKRSAEVSVEFPSELSSERTTLNSISETPLVSTSSIVVEKKEKSKKSKKEDKKAETENLPKKSKKEDLMANLPQPMESPKAPKPKEKEKKPPKPQKPEIAEKSARVPAKLAPTYGNLYPEAMLDKVKEDEMDEEKGAEWLRELRDAAAQRHHPKKPFVLPTSPRQVGAVVDRIAQSQWAAELPTKRHRHDLLLAPHRVAAADAVFNAPPAPAVVRPMSPPSDEYETASSSYDPTDSKAIPSTIPPSGHTVPSSSITKSTVPSSGSYFPYYVNTQNHYIQSKTYVPQRALIEHRRATERRL